MQQFRALSVRQTVIFLAVVAVAVFSIGLVNARMTADRPEEKLRALELADANDRFGGETPQETLELLRAALVKGDFDLAVKYFIPDKQDEMRAKFAKARANDGVIAALIKLLELNRTGTAISAESYQYSIPVENSQFVLDLVKNDKSQVWKLDAF